MPKLVKYTKADHRLSRIPSKRQYQTWMQKRINWNKIPKYTILDWKKDASEYAQRIWKCWELSKYRYTYHGVAIFLIVPVQLLNCSVEIVLSKLEKSRKVTGENLKEDMCEICWLLQVNIDLYYMQNALVLNYVGA